MATISLVFGEKNPLAVIVTFLSFSLACTKNLKTLFLKLKHKSRLQNNFVLKTSHCISRCAKEASEGPKSGYLSGSLEFCIGGDSNPPFRERQLLYDSAKCV
jgi:hypothetical protein